MKPKIHTLTLSCIFVCWAGQSLAQNYESLFGDQTTIWYLVPDSQPWCCQDSLTVIGDTLINSTSYNVIGGPGSIHGLDTIHYLREDTVQGKVWLFLPADSTEQLIMNLGLNVGDTFVIKDFDKIYPSYNTTVDSVYYLNGLKHVRLDNWIDLCGGYDEPITFIEGSGPNAGILYTKAYLFNQIIHPQVAVSMMLCHYKDSAPVPTSVNWPFNNCEYCVIGLEEPDPLYNRVKLFPNPAGEKLHIEVNAPLSPEATWTLHDFTGRKIQSANLITPLTDINISGLVPGVYFIVINDGHLKSAHRFVKE